MAQRLVDLLKNQFALAVLETHAQHGDETVVLDPGSWHEVCRFLRDAPPAQMNMLTDLTAVDFPERDPRFEIVAHLYSLQHGHRLRLKTRVGDRTGRTHGSTRLRISGVVPTGWSANASTCSAFSSSGTPICAAFSCIQRSSGIRCARTTRRSASSR